jgi:hypothetical protein
MEVLPDKSASPAPQLAGANDKKKCASGIFIVHGVPLFQRLDPTLASAAGSLFDLFQARGVFAFSDSPSGVAYSAIYLLL